MSAPTDTPDTLEAVMQPFRVMPVATPQQVEAGFRWLADTMLDALDRRGAAQPAGTPASSTHLLDREGMAAALGVGLTHFDSMRKAPGFPALHLGGGKKRGVVRFDPEAVKAYLTERARIMREMAR